MCDRYEVHGFRFGLRSSSEAFAGWLRYALGSYLVEPTADDETRYPTYSVVVEDGSGGAGRIGRRFNILYVGTSDVARTLDPRFLARCLLRQIESIGYHARDDAIFLETGVVEVGGAPSLVPKFLVPALCAARKRAEKRGISAPGGMVAALDLDTGELVAPELSLDVAPDAISRLGEYLPAGIDGARDRFPVEEGDRVAARSILSLGAGEEEPVRPRPRPATVLELATNTKNMGVLGGRALRGITAAVSAANCREIAWSSTNEMIERVALAAG